MSSFHIAVTKCQLRVKEVTGHIIDINGTKVLPPGMFLPKCKEDGTFEQVQCHPSTGYCWCVDEDGKEMLFTKTRQGIPECHRSEPSFGF